MSYLPEGFEVTAKGFIREPLAPSTVRWEDTSGSPRHAVSCVDDDFYVRWTLDTGETVKWGRLIGVVIGEQGQKSLRLESEWSAA